MELKKLIKKSTVAQKNIVALEKLHRIRQEINNMGSSVKNSKFLDKWDSIKFFAFFAKIWKNLHLVVGFLTMAEKIRSTRENFP